MTLESLPILHGSLLPSTKESIDPPLSALGVVNGAPRLMSTDPCRFARTRTLLVLDNVLEGVLEFVLDDETGSGIIEGPLAFIPSPTVISSPRVMAMLPVLET